MSVASFRGASLNQDSRWADKNKKLRKSMTFPDEYKLKVKVSAVNMEVMQPWIIAECTRLLGFDDEVVTGLVFNLLEEGGR
jgi:hypothetical protein